MGAQPFWILFDANVIENWKRHIISQKGGNYPPLERRNKWNRKIWRAHKIEPGQILLNKSSGKCSWTTWANTTINLVIERNQLTSRSPIFSWHIEHFTESEYAQHVYTYTLLTNMYCIISYFHILYCVLHKHLTIVDFNGKSVFNRLLGNSWFHGQNPWNFNFVPVLKKATHLCARARNFCNTRIASFGQFWPLLVKMCLVL